MTPTPTPTPTLAILGGTGKEGQGLALRWVRAGHEVILGSRVASKGREIADALNDKLGTTRIKGTSNREAASSAEVVVSTLPDTGHLEILTGLASELGGKILVVATIAWPPGPTSKPSAAEDAQEALGSTVRVVAAFQTVSAGTLRKEAASESEDVLICGDDADARETARALVDATGLRGVIAGALRQARVAEAITGILLKINKHYGAKSTGIRITGIEAV
ncbi:MAG: NADPH-dependent F420 reductase [Acidobacteriota bacterium]|nr:MAG: NADPH-dependent F420 reductase [Acidobacteriota bacterium]